MRENKNTKVCLLVMAIAVSLSSQDILAQEADEADELLDEIIVTGTRTLNRTVADSPVPVDVIQGDAFQNIGTGDADDILRTLVPAYNVERLPLNDEASLIRPATLRGLPADNTLILINGKRRHKAGRITGGGTQGVDVGAIPGLAIQRVEVLRDGASAQYGSDAIAGVINYITRDDSEGATIEVRTGAFYVGDGQANRITGNIGLPLTDAGFLNLSVEYGSVDSTSRSEQRSDAAVLQDLGVEGIPTPVQNYGQPLVDGELKFFASGAIEIGEDSELYAFGNFVDKDVEIEFFWRNPNALTNTYTQGRPRNRAVFDVTPDGTGNCPQAGGPNGIPVPDQLAPTQAEVDANAAALAALAADPNCWTVNEIYPSGFRPDYGADITDFSTVIGFRGQRDSGFRYDFSAAYGESDVDFRISNTLNPSLGPESPTSFDPGANVQSETNLNADFAWPVDVGLFDSPLNIGAGLEWREESFQTVAGEEASWIVGPLALQGASVGSNGYPGFSPSNAGTWDRANWAAYLDFEADITEDFLFGIAIRHEDFEDFGTTTNFKTALRYRFNDVFAIRGSYNTGFRAPTPGQSNSTVTQTRGFNGQFIQGGRIPPANPVAVFFGGQPLEPEESKNSSVGFSLEPLDNLTITADFFHIDVEGRIGTSRNFGISPQDVADLVAAGIPGATDFFFINYFTNGTDTVTEGFDVVASYNVDWGNAGSSNISLAWNQTDTEVVWQEIPRRNFKIELEERPLNRGILTINHNWRDFRFLLRASYYDEWADEDGFGLPETAPLNCADPSVGPPNPNGTDKCYGSSWMVDAEIAYTLRDRYTLIMGADNVFDEYPDEDLDYPGFAGGGRYPRQSPIGYNGGFWYLRLRAEF